jgi:hypothetical protein
MKPVTEAVEDASCDAPKKKDSKLSKEFQGKLSHASPQIRTPPITKFFSPRCTELEPDVKTRLNENVERETANSPVGRALVRRQSGEPEKSDGECLYHCPVGEI